MKQLLLAPGPVELPDPVLSAMQAPMISHKGPEFRSLLESLTERLQIVFQTRMPVITLSCSGTGSAEAAICNTCSPGDKVLVLSNGRFAQRLAAILRAYSIDVTELPFEWGSVVSAEATEEFLRKNSGFHAVWCVHSETSTGILNPVREITRSVRNNSDALVCIDAVSSLGAHEFLFDGWEIDLAISAPQKALMAPPGLGLLALSEQAWSAAARARLPRFYFDLLRARQTLAEGSTPWTPAIQEMRALDCSLGILLREGLQQAFQRHAEISLRTKLGIESLGLRVFGEACFRELPEQFSRTLTAVLCPDAPAVTERLRTHFGISVAGGQDHLWEILFRIGHAGCTSNASIDFTLAALREILESKS